MKLFGRVINGKFVKFSSAEEESNGSVDNSPIGDRETDISEIEEDQELLSGSLLKDILGIIKKKISLLNSSIDTKMPLKGGTFTGHVSTGHYLTLEAWYTGKYGEGSAKLWYDGRNNMIDCEGEVTDINLRSNDSLKFAEMTKDQWDEHILNLIKDNSSPSGATLNSCKNINIKNNTEGILLSWEDPDNIIFNGEVISEFSGTKVLRKSDSFSLNENDGTLVEDVKEKNKYKETPLLDTNVEEDNTYYYTLFPYNNVNIITRSDDNRISETFIPNPYDEILANNSWETISMASEAGIANTLWNIGDEKDGCVIIGFNHDPLSSGGNAGITFSNNTNNLSGVWNSGTTTSTTWYNSASSKTTVENLYNNLTDEKFKPYIKAVNKRCHNSASTTHLITLHFWLFSDMEVTGASTNTYKEGSKYEGASYINDSTRIWLRTPAVGYAAKRTSQNKTAYNYTADNKFILRYGFCI